jgi:hypothetical protein
LTVATYRWIQPADGSGVAVFLALLTLAFSTAVAVIMTRPFAKEIGGSFQTLRGLVQMLLAMNFAKLAERYRCSTRTDVWNVLKCIVAEQLGIDQEKVRPEASFVYDLGLD